MPALPSLQGRAGGCTARSARPPSRRRRLNSGAVVFAGPSSAAAPSSSSSSSSQQQPPSPILAAASSLAPAAVTSSSPSSTSPLVDRLGQVPVVVAPPSPDSGAGAPPPPPPAELPPPGGDGDGGDGGDGGASMWSRLDLFSRLAAGVRARAAADPAFAYKLAVECGLDAAIILGVNAAARGWSLTRLGAEAEFVLSQVAVSLLNDFALVYLLAPTVPAGAAVSVAAASASSSAGPVRALLASLPAHVLQRGPFPLSARAACFAARAAQYGAVGFTMGVTGSALVAGLTALREAADPTWSPPPTYQSVLGTGLGWLYFMSSSSNVRYNLVNGAEEALYGAAAAGTVPGLVPRAGSVALRLANNVAGARGWMATAAALELEQPRPPKKKQKSQQKGKAAVAVAQQKKAGTSGWGLRRRPAVAAAA